ncbi:MAG: hypothetical protein WCP73_01410 [Eubacteriales bacterium]
MITPDVEAVISFLKTEEGGRKTPCANGYRPAHLVKDDYLTTGVHQYYEKDLVAPGETVIGTIAFITPEIYPHCLWIGKILKIQEASKIVGYAKITKIFNELLFRVE